MNSRERFLAVLGGKMPDRVPVTLFLADQGHFLDQVYPGIDPWDFDKLHLKVLEIQRQLGVDVFVRLMMGLNDPVSIHVGGLNLSQETENWEVHTEEFCEGTMTVQRSTVRTPGGVLTQALSRNEIRPRTFVYACTQKPIKTPADLEIAVRYEPRMPESYKRSARDRVQRIKAAVGNDGIVGSWTPHGPFNNASLLIDHTELYSLFLTDYPFYERLMNFAMERVLDYARAMDEAGVDIHCVGGNVPGGFLGKRTYDTYILPFEKRYIDFVQHNGTPAMYHNCGQIMNLVESYKQLGVRVVEPFSPRPLGDADLARAKQLVGDAYVIVSGVDQINVLQKGTADQVRAATAAAMKAGKPGGGFILDNVDFLEYGTPIENLETYVATAKEQAAYSA